MLDQLVSNGLQAGMTSVDNIELLKAMETLASDRSPEARQELGRALSLWASAPEIDLTESEWLLVSSIYSAITREISSEVRAKLAERLAKRDDIPHSLIMALANDDLDVSARVLLQSPLLIDDDLIDIVRNQTTGHRACVASRSNISPNVTENIVVTGDVKAIELLLKNKTAQIAEDTFIKVGQLARKRKVLQEPLVQRADVPYSAVEKILDVVSGVMLQEICQRWQIPQSTILREMASAKREVAEQQRARRASFTPTSDPKATLIHRIEEGDLNGASWVLYHSMKLPLGVAKAVLSDISGVMLGIVFKANGADSLTYSRSLAALTKKDPSTDSDFYRAMLQRYGEMSEDWASNRVNAWRRNPASAKAEVLGGS